MVEVARGMAPTSLEWRALVDGLDDEMDSIVEDFVHAFGERALYDAEAVSQQDLRDTAEDTLRMLVARMGGRAPTDAETTLAASLGVRRARQGVPLAALLEAVRLDFRVLWRWLQRLAGDEHRAMLVDQVEWVLTVVEQYVGEVQQSFLQETAAMHRDARLATERHLLRLLSGEPPRPTALDAIAQGLGVAVDARFDLIAVPLDRIEEAQNAAAVELAAGRIFGHSDGEVYCIFWPCRDQGDLPPVLADAELPGVRLHDLRGLLGVATGARTARELLAAGPAPERLARVEELWPGIAAQRLFEIVPELVDHRLAALDDLSDYQRDAVVATVRAYLECGSVHITARRMFCHRNTVLNRLAAFRDRTGLDVQIPVEAALAHVVLAWRPSTPSLP